LAFREKCPWAFALIPRTAALFILLWQIRLLADDLADTPVFAACILGALGTALFLYLKGIKPLAGLCVIFLVPQTIRLFTALPRWFAPDFGSAAVLDSLLLNLDRNNFVALLPFYWAAGSSYFSLRNRVFLRADIIAADTVFLVLFSITPTGAMEAYRWPILMIGVFALIFFLQILAFILSLPPEMKLKKSEGAAAAVFLMLLVILGGIFFIRPSQEKAAERGGGLLEPKLFKFDFSQFLRLDTEISVNDDLVLIVKKDPGDYHVLLRRYTLSGYDRKQGFFRLEDIDEKAHPQRLPEAQTRFKDLKPVKEYRVTNQEYYLVNFDSTAFIGMNAPVETIPFETWDASSFSSAYGVKSHTSEALPFELIEAVKGESGPEALGLSPDEYRIYTEYGRDEEIAWLAQEITEGLEGYWEKIQAIYDRLKFGDYRYSLKPGIAPGGDQLKYFLFEAKKGYCSYYAFAFTLLLRSLGIPCRAAAGFFIDPETNAFDYYPVRADMAHAWTEVWFPGYGWIEYDPTAEALAEGEEFRFSSGAPPELFERLMKEILDNRFRLKPREGEEQGRNDALAGLGRETVRFLRSRGPFLFLILLLFCFLAIRSGFLWLSLLARGPRKKSILLWLHCHRRARLSGAGRSPAMTVAEWARDWDRRFTGLYALYQDYAAARFAGDYGDEDRRRMEAHYRAFNKAFSGAVPAGRRMLAWIFPPLALALKKNKSPGAAVLLLIMFFLFPGGEMPVAQNGSPGADELFKSAQEAEINENWERAVDFYSRGSRQFPDDMRFSWALGNLYYQRQLFRLAWEEYRKANALLPWDPGILFQLSRTAGYLNEDSLSAGYLERLLTLEPDNRTAIGNLGWMYYKIHRLDDGERLLREAVERMGPEADFAMTLGSIYSDKFNYTEAKRWYLEAIAGAEAVNNREFAAVAHYNLSILESRFYHFDLAYDRTNASLETMNRASGRLARGELQLRRMALPRALAEYQEAYEMDSSPLSRLNLAQVYQIGGRLEEARLYAEDCLKTGDHSWMLNYGIDPVRYKSDIHEILQAAYEGLEKAEAFAAPAGGIERLKSLARTLAYRFRAGVHGHLFRKYSLLAARAYAKNSGLAGGETHLDALTQYYNAFEPYPSRARYYLEMARNYEEALIPESAPAYDLEAGQLLNRREQIARTIPRFDPQWERDMIAEAYAELAARGPASGRRDAAERLFALNRGGLRQKGIRLPVELKIEGVSSKTEAALRKAVKAAGMDAAAGLFRAAVQAPRFTLNLSAGEKGESIRCELYDGGRGALVYQGSISLPSLRPSDCGTFAHALGNRVFNGF
jgi:hypothetical protein